MSDRRSTLDAVAESCLEGETGTIRLSPATAHIEVAHKWLLLAGGSLDGVVAKRLDVPYQPGTSKAMQKVKRLRTLPEPLRRYIHDLETNVDPADMVQD